MQKKSIFIVLCFLFLFSVSTAYSQPKSDYLEQGIKQYSVENYDEAIVVLEKARAINPKSSAVAYYLGMAYKLGLHKWSDLDWRTLRAKLIPPNLDLFAPPAPEADPVVKIKDLPLDPAENLEQLAARLPDSGSDTYPPPPAPVPDAAPAPATSPQPVPMPQLLPPAVGRRIINRGLNR